MARPRKRIPPTSSRMRVSSRPAAAAEKRPWRRFAAPRSSGPNRPDASKRRTSARPPSSPTSRRHHARIAHRAPPAKRPSAEAEAARTHHAQRPLRAHGEAPLLLSHARGPPTGNPDGDQRAAPSMCGAARLERRQPAAGASWLRTTAQRPAGSRSRLRDSPPLPANREPGEGGQSVFCVPLPLQEVATARRKHCGPNCAFNLQPRTVRRLPRAPRRAASQTVEMLSETSPHMYGGAVGNGGMAPGGAWRCACKRPAPRLYDGAMVRADLQK